MDFWRQTLKIIYCPPPPTQRSHNDVAMMRIRIHQHRVRARIYKV